MDALITLTGNLATPVSVKAGEGSSGKWCRADFRLASTRRVRRSDGTWVDAGTTWVGVQAWGRLADGIKDSLSKGDPVIVMGRLVTDEWTDADGVAKSRNLVVADAVGPDLSRGRARFQRTTPLPPSVDDPDDTAAPPADVAASELDEAFAELTAGVHLGVAP